MVGLQSLSSWVNQAKPNRGSMMQVAREEKQRIGWWVHTPNPAGGMNMEHTLGAQRVNAIDERMVRKLGEGIPTPLE
ncbi:hypothetical protein VNO77_04456 [Canavalia gladiata]|uniref:Uncharacterized protein n=1 Tax=Canavalia gladiata TaxID=3824 RepID=A0AAN9R4T2_CANGL